MKFENIWSDEPVSSLLLLSRGKAKTAAYKEIIIEALRMAVPRKLTKDELQRAAAIKRNRFVALLKLMVEEGIVSREGTGLKGQPFRYYLSERN